MPAVLPKTAADRNPTDQKQQILRTGVCVSNITSSEPHAGVTDRIVCALTAVEPTTSPHIPTLVGML